MLIKGRPIESLDKKLFAKGFAPVVGYILSPYPPLLFLLPPFFYFPPSTPPSSPPVFFSERPPPSFLPSIRMPLVFVNLSSVPSPPLPLPYFPLLCFWSSSFPLFKGFNPG